MFGEFAVYGVGEDAADIAMKVSSDDRPASVAQIADAPDTGWLSHDFCCS